MLGLFAEMGITPSILWQRLLRREGLNQLGEIIDDFRHRFRDEAVQLFQQGLKASAERSRKRSWFEEGVDYNAEPALMVLPAPLFLDVEEDGAELSEHSLWRVVEEANRLFSKRGIHYRLNDYGQAEWHGDQATYEAVVLPALEALRDPRMQGARSEFEAAVAHLRAGTDKDREDAIEEAGKSVESAMKVLLDAQKVARNGNETAFPLSDMLSSNRIVIAEAKEAVVGTARIRNSYGGHGAGGTARKVPSRLAELAVRSAATAITFLVAHLP